MVRDFFIVSVCGRKSEEPHSVAEAFWDQSQPAFACSKSIKIPEQGNADWNGTKIHGEFVALMNSIHS